MRGERAGRARGVAVRAFVIINRLTTGFFKFGARQHTGPQQHRPAAGAIDDGRFNADGARPAVEHVNRVAEFLLHMLHRRRADAAKPIGAGAGHAVDAEVQAGA
jgi:hypothetical protein